MDIVTALGIIGHGVVANWLIFAPVLLFLFGLPFLSIQPSSLLHQPKFLKWDLAEAIAKFGLPVSDPLWGISGYWFTVILLVINVLFLVFWAFAKSISVSQVWQKEFSLQRKPGNSAELRGGLVTISKLLFFCNSGSSMARNSALHSPCNDRQHAARTNFGCPRRQLGRDLAQMV